MHDHTRRAVAFVVGLAFGNDASSVYDYKAGRHFSFTGTVSNDSVSAYDYSESCHISGTLSSIFHYGDNHHIQLTINGHNFNGFDYGTSTHFSGTCNGNSISIYDHGESEHFNYSV